jgi:membrane protein required for colicin V production
MTILDIIVLAVIGISILLGMIKGLVREVMSLAAWVMAFLAANLAAPEAAQLLPQGMASEEIRLLAGFAVVFVLVLIGLSVLAVMASKLIKIAGLGMADRVLGGVFGLVRGALVVTILVLLAGLTSLPRQPVWRNAFLGPTLESSAGYVKTWLPAELSKRIKY